MYEPNFKYFSLNIFMKGLFTLLAGVALPLPLPLSFPALAEEKPPISEGAATVSDEEVARKTEVIVTLGNESNPGDGVFGPFTYGLHGSHQFENELVVEAGYIQLHEPSTSVFSSVVDEAQMNLRAPDYHSLAVGLTVWKNRMVDMYTHLYGIEATRKDQVSVTIGGYMGTANREDVSENFRGVQLGLSAPTAFAEVSSACLFGKIGEGSYRKCGITGGLDFRENSSLPLTVTFSVEERFFDFGKGGPRSEPRDEFIFISGLEIHVDRLL